MSSIFSDTITILYVDNNPDFLEMAGAALERNNENFTVEPIQSAADAVEIVDEERPDCVISDYNMPNMTGIEFCKAVRDRHPEIPFILFTGKGSESIASEAISAGVTDYFQKGKSNEQYTLLANRIMNAVSAYRTAHRAKRQEELMRLTQQIGSAGGWELHVETDDLLLTDGARRILDLDETGPFSVEVLINQFHAADRPEIRTALDQAASMAESTRDIWRVPTPDLSYRFIELNIEHAVADSDGTILRGAVHDVTEHERRSRQVDAERQMFDQAIESLEDLFYVVGVDGTIQQWNGRVAAVTGYSETELQGMDATEIFPESQRQKISEAIAKAVSMGQSTVQADILSANGRRIPCEFSGSPITDSDGEVTQVVGIGRDLRKRRERERQFQALVEQSTDLISIIDAEGQFQYQSPSIKHVLGYNPAETVGDTIFEYIHPEDRDEVVQQFERWLSNPDTPPVVQCRVRHADGSWRWMEARGSNQTNNPIVAGYVINSRDITDQKHRESELRRHRDFLQNSQTVANIGGWEFDPQSETLRWTEELYRIHGLPGERELSIEEAIEFYHPEDRETIRQAVDQLLETGDEFNLELRIQTANEELRWVRAVGRSTTDESGTIVGAHGVFQDITERKQRSKELRRKSRAIDEAPVGIVITDPSQDDNPMIYVNQQFVDLSGYPREEVIGSNCRFLQGDRTASEPVAGLRSAIDAEEAVSVELRNYRNDGSEFWNQLKVSPVQDESGEVVNYVGFQQDVTERIEREQALKKRERILRELHTATRDFYPPSSPTDISEFLVEFIDRAFEFGYVSVKQYDTETGSLRPAAVSSSSSEGYAFGPVEPGATPIWQAYQEGEPAIFDGKHLPQIDTPVASPVDRALVVPIGEFGVAVAFDTADSDFDQVEVELIEVVTANAEAAFQRLRSDRARTEITNELSELEAQMSDLSGIIDVLRDIQNRLANNDSQAGLETAVCDGLVETNRIDFAWIGRPQGRDTNLTPTEWAGDGDRFLGRLDTQTDDPALPARQTATEREQTAIPNISELVFDEPWAKEAISAGFQSTLCVPLVYDDVLYGTLSVYSHQRAAFDPVYEDLLTNVASLLVNYSRILERRYGDSQSEQIVREFELGGSTYPLQRLATATDSRLRFDTVAENSDRTIRILVTVVDGSTPTVLATATSINSIVAAESFGATEDNQLSLMIKKPFLASVIAKHGGRLLHSISDSTGTTVRLAVPTNISHRPLVDSLQSRYADIHLLSQRQTHRPQTVDANAVVEMLTDRQQEILGAAYHGGYYETPRRVTGEDLAENFDISSPTVYNHLQAAHRTILSSIYESVSDINFENDGLDI